MGLSRWTEPDALALAIEGTSPPYRYDPFVENDDRIGWYGELAWRSRAGARVTLMHYDNRADPRSFSRYDGRDVFSWDTRFWSLGAEARFGDVLVVGQAMHGDSAFQPSEFYASETEFSAAYVLAALERGEWRPAARLDFFSTRQHPSSPPEDNEHGYALTLALNWRPREWLRVTAEALRVDSSRTQRARVGLAESSVDIQVQLSARLLF